MSGILFHPELAWILIEGGEARIGVSDFAQETLGSLVNVDLPNIGARIEQNTPFAVLESFKAASDVIAPASGTVLEVNPILADDPEQVNRSPAGEGWLIRIAVDGTAPDLMSEVEYNRFADGL